MDNYFVYNYFFTFWIAALWQILRNKTKGMNILKTLNTPLKNIFQEYSSDLLSH